MNCDFECNLVFWAVGVEIIRKICSRHKTLPSMNLLEARTLTGSSLSGVLLLLFYGAGQGQVLWQWQKSLLFWILKGCRVSNQMNLNSIPVGTQIHLMVLCRITATATAEWKFTSQVVLFNRHNQWIILQDSTMVVRPQRCLGIFFTWHQAEPNWHLLINLFDHNLLVMKPIYCFLNCSGCKIKDYLVLVLFGNVPHSEAFLHAWLFHYTSHSTTCSFQLPYHWNHYADIWIPNNS